MHTTGPWMCSRAHLRRERGRDSPPGMQSLTGVAPMTATLSGLFKGRRLTDVVTGGDTVENKGDGIFLSHSQRYDITRELTEIYVALMTRHS